MATKKKKAKTRSAATARRKAPARKAAARPARPVRKGPETLRLRSAAPGFTVNDIEKSMAWYRDVLGCVVEERWEHEGKLEGVSMLAGAVSFMLSQDDWKKGRDRKKGEGVRLWFGTAQDVDELAGRIQAAGFSLTEEPKDAPWGRNFSLDDPDGYQGGDPIVDRRPFEWRRPSYFFSW